LPFFCIFHIFSQFNLLSSIISMSFHYFLLYFPYLITIRLAFHRYFPYNFTIQPTFFPHFPYLFTIQLIFLS
jgi:hypothetical protein